ncbi:MAG: fibronectin type III domain-containing protein, partial [Bacteroidales bacterium]|nr:fibronectin type III domain-containing protein [Bacteroidales bacterium]
MRKISLLITLLVIVQTSCQEEIPQVLKIRIETLSAAYVRASSATLRGEIIDFGKGIIDHGHCWAEHSNPVPGDFSSSFGPVTDENKFITELDKLEADKTYYFRAWAEGDDGIIYGEVLSFTTSDGIIR